MEWFKIVTPVGEWDLTSEEFVEFCSNVVNGKGNECFPDAKRKAKEMWQANLEWLPDAY